MKTNLFSLTSKGRCGPGGWTSTCCVPPRGSRARLARLHKRRINRMLDRELRKELAVQD